MAISSILVIVLCKDNIECITYLNARTDDNPVLFVSSKSPHARLTRRRLEDILNRISTNANVEKVHPHRFKRTSATDLLNAGMPIEQVQEFLRASFPHAYRLKYPVYLCCKIMQCAEKIADNAVSPSSAYEEYAYVTINKRYTAASHLI